MRSQLLPTPIGPHQVLMCIDAGTVGELLEEYTIEPTRGTVVDVFDGSLMA
jgi:hypothetical protein